MRVTQTRPNVVTLVATSQELSALVSGARMALGLITADADAPPQAGNLAQLLAAVLGDYDAAITRVREEP